MLRCVVSCVFSWDSGSHFCSGLDPNRYKSVTLGDVEGRGLGSLGSLLSEKERFKDADPFIVRCKSCQGEGIFAPVGDRAVCLVLLTRRAMLLMPHSQVVDAVLCGTFMSRLPCTSRNSKPSSTVSSTNPRAYLQVLSALDAL